MLTPTWQWESPTATGRARLRTIFSPTTLGHPAPSRLRKDQQKLVPAHPRHGIAASDTGLKPPGHLSQDGIASLVPPGIVDSLEEVKVEVQNRHTRLAPPGPGDRLGETVLGQRPVGQAGQPVMGRQATQVRFGVLAGRISLKIAA
jgi:hypothetical protein